MPLWGMSDFANNAPKYAVAAGIGVSANANVLFDNVQSGVFRSGIGLGVFGVDAREKTNTSFEGPKMAHAGWVKRITGTGYVVSVAVTNGGTGYTPGPGWITFSGGGTSNNSANAQFQVNAAGSVANVTINVTATLSGGGANYNAAPTANATVAFATPAVFVVTTGGRIGRRSYETLVASGSMGFDGTANTDDAVVGA